MRARAYGGERGASAPEYVGAVVIAAVLVGAIVLAISPMGANVRAAACEAVGTILNTDLGCRAGGEDGATPPKDEDFHPGVCEVSQDGTKVNSAVSIAFIDIGENAGLVRKVMSDGTVKLTATDGSDLGASGGVGADLRTGGGVDVGASVDFGGGVKLGMGDTWTFPDAAAADEFESLLNDHRMRERAYREPGMGGLVADVIDPLDPLPQPDSVTTDVGVTADVESQLGATLTAKEDGTGANTGLEAVAASVDANAKWSRTTNTNGTESAQDDTQTYTVDMSISPDVSSDIWKADLGLGKTEGMSMAVTQNADNQVTEIKIVTTSQGAINGGVTLDGGGKDGTGKKSKSGKGSVFASSEDTTATVTTTTLKLDPDAPGYEEDAAIVQDWLGGNGEGYSWPGTIPMGAVNPAHEGSDPFSQLMHERATVSAVTNEGVKSTAGLAAEVKLGLKFGFDFSASQSESDAVYATYLGAPSNGTREMVPYPDCIG